MVDWARIGKLVAGAAIGYPIAKSFVGPIVAGIGLGQGIDVGDLAIVALAGYGVDRAPAEWKDVVAGIAVGAGIATATPFVKDLIEGLAPTPIQPQGRPTVSLEVKSLEDYLAARGYV